MANTINLAKVYTPLIDELYRATSKTTVLNSNEEYIRQGANSKEILYPQVNVNGLGDYSRNDGYTNNAVNVEWKTATFGYDRGTKISVDSMDDQETFNISFSGAMQSLIKDKVAPEADAYTFATLAGIDGISVAEAATYANAEEFLAALIVAKNKMDEDEVPEENRILFATPTLVNGVMALETYKSREVLNSFAQVISVPQSRFYTAIDLKDGKSSGEEAGHYAKAADGKDINFMIVHKPAVIKGDKHVVSNVISPANNPDSDAYISKYRKYGIVDVLANKVAGIYLSHKA
jgi:hypothetical protein